ncbi:hypothetical protein CYMTET_26838 [Cymbomonas tetramitiformis]|uniref:Uncharacterized protein n=1 Tax=Cymbomonas tetramitiformis TaxID=36881 RepID=A0AAE0KXR9_9CHLO|nr:hypothetical protein CYMTET_26838 [Cymbomonas tetramitiformis]
MISTILALVIEDRGGTPFHTAAAYIAFKIANFFSTPLFSAFLDRDGLQNWMIISCVLGNTFAYLFLALAQDPYLSLAGMAVWGFSASPVPLLSKTYFATTLPPDLASYYVLQNRMAICIAATISPFFGGFLFTGYGDVAPFIGSLGLWLSSVAFAARNIKVPARDLYGELSDTSEGTRMQDDPTLETSSYDTRNEDARENDVSREEMQSQESRLCEETEQITLSRNPTFEAEPTDEVESLDTVKGDRVSDNIPDSQPVAQSSNGSYVIVATFMAGSMFQACFSTNNPLLILYARNKFDVDAVDVSLVITVGEAGALLKTILMQQKPDLLAPGGLFACVGLVWALLLQYFSKEEQSISFEGIGLFYVGVVLSLITYHVIRLQFDAILLRCVNKNEAAIMFGKLNCAQMLGDVIGMFLGSLIWEWNWKLIMLVPAIPLVLCIFSILFWIYHCARASSSKDNCDVVPGCISTTREFREANLMKRLELASTCRVHVHVASAKPRLLLAQEACDLG